MAIATWLNNHEIKRNLRDNTRTKTFTNSSAQRMITNPVYIKKIAYGRNLARIHNGNTFSNLQQQ